MEAAHQILGQSGSELCILMGQYLYNLMGQNANQIQTHMSDLEINKKNVNLKEPYKL